MALVMETRPAAYAVIIEQGKLLMTRWAPEDRSHEPLWTLPGGGMEPGEQADETALRETLEETGYSVAIEDVLGVHAGHFPARNGMYGNSLPFCALRIIYRAHIVTGQLLAFSMNAIINSLQGGPMITIAEDPSGHFAPGQYVFDEIAKLQSSKGGPMNAEQYHAFLDQLSISAGNGEAWRYMLVLCSIRAVALWSGIRLMPESSRWYLAKERLYDAIGALKRVRVPEKDGSIEDEIMEMGEARQHEKDEETQRKGFSHVMATPWLRKLLLVGIFLAVVNQTTGVNTVMYYAPKVLEYAGMSTSASITAQVANGVMSVIGSAIGIWLILKFRRRQVLIGDVIGVGITLLGIAATFQFFIAPHMANHTTPPTWAAYLILGLMSVFMLIVQSSNGTIVWTMMGEIFPANVRGIMNGTAIFCMWTANAIITWTFPPMMETLGGGITYTIYGVLNLVVAVVLFKIMPETKDKSLEEIEVEMEKLYS